MAVLVCDGRVVCEAEVAAARAARVRGLLGRDSVDGVLVLPGARGVHTIGMRFPIDVAHVRGDGVVLTSVTMRPNRLGRTRWSARSVVEAEAGRLRELGVGPGAKVEIR